MKINKFFKLEQFSCSILVLLVSGFILGVWATCGDTPVNVGISVSDLWAAYSGVSIPLTFAIYALQNYKDRNISLRENRKIAFANIKLFILEIEPFVEHMKNYSVEIDMSILSCLQGVEDNDLFYELLLHLYQIGKLSPNKGNCPRVNYLMRLEIDKIFYLIQQIINTGTKKGYCYSFAKTKTINNKDNGDEEIEKHTLEIYEKQKKHIKTEYNKGGKKEILMEIKEKLQIH